MSDDETPDAQPSPQWVVSTVDIVRKLVLAAVATTGVNLLSAWRLPTVSAVLVAVVVVVALGATGLILRGIGELKGSPKWKATGYFFGAAAYIATATAALANTLPHLLGG